jgi:anti-anti-sigma factor
MTLPPPAEITMPEHVTYETAAEIRGALTVAQTAGQSRIIVDMSGVTSSDSTGLSPVVTAAGRASEQGGWLAIAAPDERARRLIEMTGLARVLRVFETVDGARAAAALLEQDSC